MERTKKGIAGFILIFFIYSGAFAQDVYYVTFIKGEVKKANAAKVKVGDKLFSQESVNFSTKDSRLILLHPQKGRFIIEPPAATKQASGEYLVFIKNSLLPDIKKVKLSSRGNQELQSYFTVDEAINENLLLIGETNIPFGANEFNIKDTANDFFFLQYTNSKGKTITNKLKVKKNKLLIRPPDLRFDGAVLPGGKEVFIGFVENYSTQKAIAEIGFFKPISMSLVDCKKLMQTIQKALGKNKKLVVDETYSQLYKNYGKPDMEVLRNIYDKL